MAEDESASTPYTEDDFYCTICQEVFKTPVRVAACQHVFCRKCFLTAMKESRIHCPLCRGNVARRERSRPERALDLETIMRSFPGSCRYCSQRIELCRMRQHYKTCKKYQDEFGVSSSPSSFQLSPDSVGNNQPSFDCPLCEEANMTRQRLLDHCNSNHRAHIVPSICPICLSLPWGNPTQLIRNFVSHLNERHQFDYGDFMNLQLDEETQYQIAVEESLNVNI
ncbi:E3 ubiquitin-protein ligase RNF138 [Lemmus lemmus]